MAAGLPLQGPRPAAWWWRAGHGCRRRPGPPTELGLCRQAGMAPWRIGLWAALGLGLGLGLAALPAAAGPAPALADLSGPGPAWSQPASQQALAQACTQDLARIRQAQLAMRRLPADGQWLAAHDRFAAQLEDASSRMSLLAAVHPDKALRSAAEACEQRWNNYVTALGQDQALYRALLALPAGDAVDAELARQLREGFEDAGVALAPAQRAAARRLNERINALSQRFDRQIRDARVRVPFTEAELDGVPEAVWKTAPRDRAGRVLLGLDHPTHEAVLRNGSVAAARQRMWRAKTDAGGAGNLRILAELARLRQQYAALFGAPSWAEFVIRRRMASSAQRVEGFLGEVHAAVREREAREVQELRAAKAEHLGQPLDGLRLERWDVLFYSERLRRARHAVDQELFRPYFPPQQSLALALRVMERLLGLRYERLADAPAWHPEVQTYAVHDAATGQRLATLWIDPFPREGKFNHAAVWPLRSGSAALGRLPQAALVVNLDRRGLSLDEMETLLHELGHAVHNNLSAPRYAQLAGTRVVTDFVEAPSQMLESWVFDARVLGLMAEVCPDCKPVPPELLAQADAARRFGQGIDQARQWLYASYDLALYGPLPPDPLALWQRMEGATPVGHVPGSMWPAGFSHSAGGYSAGVYSYLWSLVLATDLRTAFAADPLDATVGRRYRETVLAPGASRPPAQLVKDFLGRDFDARAFHAELAR